MEHLYHVRGVYFFSFLLKKKFAFKFNLFVFLFFFITHYEFFDRIEKVK